MEVLGTGPAEVEGLLSRGGDVVGSPSLAKAENLFDSGSAGGAVEVSPEFCLPRTRTSAQVDLLRGVEQKEGRGLVAGSQTRVS